jgi:hypothetical protein
MKAHKDFRLSKTSKRALAVLPSDKRGHWKGMLITAELAEKQAKMAKIREPKGEA